MRAVCSPRRPAKRCQSGVVEEAFLDDEVAARRTRQQFGQRVGIETHAVVESDERVPGSLERAKARAVCAGPILDDERWWKPGGEVTRPGGRRREARAVGIVRDAIDGPAISRRHGETVTRADLVELVLVLGEMLERGRIERPELRE